MLCSSFFQAKFTTPTSAVCRNLLEIEMTLGPEADRKDMLFNIGDSISNNGAGRYKGILGNRGVTHSVPTALNAVGTEWVTSMQWVRNGSRLGYRGWYKGQLSKTFQGLNCDCFLSHQFKHVFNVIKRTISQRRFF